MKNCNETKFIEDLNSFSIFENIINENDVSTKYDIFHYHFLNPKSTGGCSTPPPSEVFG